MPRKRKYAPSSLFLKIFLWCFVVFNLSVFYYLYITSAPSCSKSGTCLINTKRLNLPVEKRGKTKYFNVLHNYYKILNNEYRLIPFENIDFAFTDSLKELNCSSLSRVEKARFIAAGYTKSTFEIKLDNLSLSLKTVNIEGHDMNECLLEEGRDIYDCFLLSAAKLLQEIAILKSIAHTNIVKVYGYCVPVNPDIADTKHTVAIFEEYGEPIEVIKLLQLSWEDRLKICLGLSQLLKHLSTFDETIALNDFRRQQFILVKGEAKLIDVDDVGTHEHRCNKEPCCLNPLLVNHTTCLPCVNHICKGYNEKINIIRTGKHFIRHILPYGAPKEFSLAAKRITNAFLSASLGAFSICKEIEDLVHHFKNGLYIEAKRISYLSGYKQYDGRDISSEFDYRCQLTLPGYGCMTSVFDDIEAAEICWMDSKCKAFILTNIKTWTGRRIAIFKSGFGNLIQNNRTKLYIKL